MAAPVIQLRVPEDTLNRVDQARGDDTRSAWLQRLIDGELAGQQAFNAVVVGEYQRAFYGSQYALMAPLFEHYGVQLWLPRPAGG